MVDAAQLVSFFANGIVLGSIVALAAVGLTLVYGILDLANFAHGDFLTLGVYVTFFLTVVSTPVEMRWIGGAVAILLVVALAADHATIKKLTGTERRVGLWVALTLVAGLILERTEPNFLPGFLSHDIFLAALIAMVLVAAFSAGLDFILWRPLRRRNATIVTLIIVSIGLALVVRHAIQLRFGSGLHTFRQPLRAPLLLGPITITQIQVLTVVVAAVLALAVHIILRHTRFGKALRALADNMDLARVSGIDVDRMIVHLWLLSGGLVAVAGVLLALNVNVNPNLGWNMLLPIFAAVILGGIGSAYGAFGGALVIAVAMELSVAWVPEYRFGVGFLLLILVLLIRPQGIFGGKTE